jgi:polyisoprenoid-binding protein YceI
MPPARDPQQAVQKDGVQEKTMPTTHWTIDASHSGIHFSVRHLVIAKVRGKFTSFNGALELDEADLTKSKVDVSIDIASVNTSDEKRDAHLRSGDFFDVERFPTATFKSTSITKSGDGYLVKGELNVHGVTKEVDLNTTFEGIGKDPWGGERTAFQAKTSINREDWGMKFNMPLDGGGVVVGTRIDLELEIEAVKAK